MEKIVLSCLESRVEENQSIYSRFLLGPFISGHAVTIATNLRRALLSEVKNIAITALHIQGITHEFSTVVGVRESVLELSLNFQQVVLSTQTRTKAVQVGYLHSQGPAVIYANDLKLPLGIECVNPTQYIATLSTEGVLIVKFLIGENKSCLKATTSTLNRTKIEKAKAASRSNLNSSSNSSLNQPEVVYANSTSNSSSKQPKVADVNSRSNPLPSKRGFKATQPEVSDSNSLSNPPSSKRGWVASQPPLEEGGLTTQPEVGDATSTSTSNPSEAQDRETRVRGSQVRGARVRGRGSDRDRVSGDPAVLYADSHQLGRSVLTEFDSEVCLRTIIPLEPIFPTVYQVNFVIERDDLSNQVRERVIMEVWTNGSIHPRQAIHEAALSTMSIFSKLRKTFQLDSHSLRRRRLRIPARAISTVNSSGSGRSAAGRLYRTKSVVKGSAPAEDTTGKESKSVAKQENGTPLPHPKYLRRLIYKFCFAKGDFAFSEGARTHQRLVRVRSIDDQFTPVMMRYLVDRRYDLLAKLKQIRPGCNRNYVPTTRRCFTNRPLTDCERYRVYDTKGFEQAIRSGTHAESLFLSKERCVNFPKLNTFFSLGLVRSRYPVALLLQRFGRSQIQGQAFLLEQSFGLKARFFKEQKDDTFKSTFLPSFNFKVLSTSKDSLSSPLQTAYKTDRSTDTAEEGVKVSIEKSRPEDQVKSQVLQNKVSKYQILSDTRHTYRRDRADDQFSSVSEEQILQHKVLSRFFATQPEVGYDGSHAPLLMAQQKTKSIFFLIKYRTFCFTKNALRVFGWKQEDSFQPFLLPIVKQLIRSKMARVINSCLSLTSKRSLSGFDIKSSILKNTIKKQFGFFQFACNDLSTSRHSLQETWMKHMRVNISLYKRGTVFTTSPLMMKKVPPLCLPSGFVTLVFCKEDPKQLDKTLSHPSLKQDTVTQHLFQKLLQDHDNLLPARRRWLWGGEPHRRSFSAAVFGFTSGKISKFCRLAKSNLTSANTYPYRSEPPLLKAKSSFAKQNLVSRTENLEIEQSSDKQIRAGSEPFYQRRTQQRLSILYPSTVDKMSFLSSDLANLSLSLKTYTFLKKKGKKNIASILEYSPNALFDFLNGDEKMFYEIKRCLLILGLPFKE